MSSEMTTVERRATRASTRNGGGNGRARVDGRDATRTKIYAAEDGSRPVGKKRERGGDDATTRGDGGDGKKKKKKKRMYNRAFAEVMKRRNMGASAADAAKEKEKEKEKKEKKKKSRAPPTAPRASAAVEEKASEKASEKTTTSKASKGKKKSAAARDRPPKRKYWKMINLEGEIFRVGDSAYVVNEKTVDFEEDEDVPCMVCGEAPDADRPMLECDTCLSGWHLCCLKPPLTRVPDNDWHCPLCTRGGEAASSVPRIESSTRTACTEFMAGRLHMARIEHIWEECGEYHFAARWYATPEETHMGRQPIQQRREVFLTHTVDINPVECLFRVAKVCTPREFRDEEGASHDTYVCEYTYDAAFQRFKRRGEWGEEDEFSDDERFDNELDWMEEDDDDEWNGKKKKAKNASTRGRLAALTARHRAENAAAQLDITGFGGSALGRGRKHPSTVLGGVRAVLSLASTPATLPCRERERKQVYDFVYEAIVAGADSAGKCLYISGVPGTGKTATVREIIRVLRSQARTGSIPKFNHVELNALRLQTPKHAYSTIAEELMGQKFSPEKASIVLEKRFKDGKGSDGRVTVLIVDELDLLVTQRQDVLYNIFDWPTHKKSRLVVIGIANTLDVPERMLPRIASRLGSNRAAFAPYSWEQLKKIVTSRLESVEGCSDAYAPSTLDLICRKVASVNGDARRALELARRAAEVAEARINVEKVTTVSQPVNGATRTSDVGADARAKARLEKVTMEDVRQAQSEMFEGPHMKLILSASFYERLFLVALVKTLQRAGTTTVDMGSVMEMQKVMCKDPRVNVTEPPIGSGVRIASSLRSTHLIVTDASARRNLQQISLSVPVADVTFALVENCENDACDMPWVKYVL